MNYRIQKVQGAGNDFLFFDAMEKPIEGWPQGWTDEWVPLLCNRNFGLGADGVAILEKGETTDCRWRFFNSDASRAEMCGNAARCAIQYLEKNYFPNKKDITLETLAGVVRGNVIDTSTVEVSLKIEGGPDQIYQEKLIKHEQDVWRLHCVNTGVPHAVLEVENLVNYSVIETGQALVGHPTFAPAGTNVTFFQKVGEKKILSTTFERGVEEETFACGTGVCAAAIVYAQLYAQKFPIHVEAPGGQLTVGRGKEEGEIALTGPAQHVGEMQWAPPASDWKLPLLYSERSEREI